MLKINRLQAVILGTLMCFSILSAAKDKSGNVKPAGPELPEAASGQSMINVKPIVMLRVNGEDITVQDYATFLQHNAAYVQNAFDSNEGKKKALQAMVGAILIRGALEREPGLLPAQAKPTKEDYTSAYEKLAEKYFPIPAPPDEKTAYQYYLDHADNYGIPAIVRVSQIQVRFPEKASEEQKQTAKSKAEGALKRLEAGEDFGVVAEQMTENPLAKLPKGDLGFLPLNSDPWLKKAVEGLKPGERTGVIESKVGYDILKLVDLRPALTSPFANVREKVIQTIKDEAQNKSRDAYIEKLAKTANIELVQEELKAVFPRGVFP